MILRHVREPIDGQPIENTFESVDERSGAAICTCTIYSNENAELFPTRPTRIYLDIQGNTIPDSLLGAAVARAKEIALQGQTPSRIFAQVYPEDARLMASLSALGFKDNDGLVCMQRTLQADTQAAPEPPLGCVVVQDDLDDPIEQKYFLERYNQLYNEDHDFEWLQDFLSHKNFKRILIVAPTGMVGEIIFWETNGHGCIAWLFVSRKWRLHGVSRCLLALACAELAAQGVPSVEAEVQARISGMLRVMEGAGFRQSKLILRYPGIDMN